MNLSHPALRDGLRWQLHDSRRRLLEQLLLHRRHPGKQRRHVDARWETRLRNRFKRLQTRWKHRRRRGRGRLDSRQRRLLHQRHLDGVGGLRQRVQVRRRARKLRERCCRCRLLLRLLLLDDDVGSGGQGRCWRRIDGCRRSLKKKHILKSKSIVLPRMDFRVR